MPSDLHNPLMDLRGKKVEFAEHHPLGGRTGVVMDVHPHPVDAQDVEGNPLEGGVVRVRLDGTVGLVGCSQNDIVVVHPVTGEAIEPEKLPPGEPDDELV